MHTFATDSRRGPGSLKTWIAGLGILVLALFGVVVATGEGRAVSVLLAEGDSDLNVEPRLTGLGHTVTVQNAATWDSTFDYSAFDVVAFQFRSSNPADIGHLVDAVDAGDVGVVFFRGAEAEPTAQALGLIAGGSLWWQTPTDLNIINNTHEITQGFSLGIHNLGYTFMTRVDSTGANTTILATGPDGTALLVHNTRRAVITPYYAHPQGHDDENETGLAITENTVQWAAATSSCVSDGDVNNDGSLTPGDALCAFNIFLGGGTLPPDCDVPDWDCELMAADPTCDGQVTPGDALAIFNRFLAGLPPEECFAATSAVGAFGTSPADRNPFDVRMDRVVSRGNVFSVPVVMEAAQGQPAFGFELRYDPDMVRFDGLEPGGLAQEWTGFGAKEVEPGRLIVGAFDVKGLSASEVARGGKVQLAELRFVRLTGEFVLDVVTWTEHVLLPVPGGEEPQTQTDRVTSLGLSQPFPNPARDGIQTFVSVPNGEQHTVRVAVYDVQGRLVKTLLDRAVSGGTHAVSWDQRNAQGSPVSSGIYFVQMNVRERGLIDTKKIVVVR